MWSIESFWFEIAIVSIIYSIGNILFGHFEEHTPKIRKIGKFILILVIIVGASALFNRTIAMILLVISGFPAIYIHLFYLPKKGINGWTGEPKEKYYELRGWDKSKLEDKKNTDEVG